MNWKKKLPIDQIRKDRGKEKEVGKSGQWKNTNKMVEIYKNLSVIKINTNKVYFLQIKYSNCKIRF